MKIEIEKATRQEALQFQVRYRNPIESIAHAFVALNPKALKVINQHIKERPIKAPSMGSISKPSRMFSANMETRFKETPSRGYMSSSRIICVMGTVQAVFAMMPLSAIIRFDMFFQCICINRCQLMR